METKNAYFDRVYDETAPLIKRFLVIRIQNAADMEDVFQETYKKFYQRISAVRPNEPLRYLYAIARHELSSRYRKTARRWEAESPLLETAGDPAPPFEEGVLASLTADAVWETVKREPLKSYQAFVLFYGFDMTIRQIAGELGLSEDAVKARLHRTRERMKQQWKGAEGQ